LSNKPKLFIVSHEYKADYKVCFTEHDYKQKNHQLLLGGELVKQEYQADYKLFITEHEYQADILITRKHFPK